MLPNDGFASARIEDVIEDVVADDFLVSVDSIVIYLGGNRTTFSAAIKNASRAAADMTTIADDEL